ncbi:MAG TPA: ribonuclease J, partial [Armatimonadota bacterium]|nr:ribonuclease J [Armatimonadota bacterium]
ALASSSGILALMCDVTNIERPGWVTSERSVAVTFDELFADADGRIIVACFASNIFRMQEVINVAARYGRRVCVIGRSMRANVDIARELGFMHLPSPDILIEPDAAASLPAKEVAVLTTGTQGEPLSALRLMSTGEHKYIKVGPGDLVVISASPIPGNEDLVYRTINQLFRQGAEVVYHGAEHTHVSGHGHEEELKMMLTLTAPRHLVPMHGEFRHLVRYRKTAETMGYTADRVSLLHSGDVLEITRDGAAVRGQVQAGRVMIDGLGVGDIGAVVLRDRKHLSEDGMLTAVVGIDSQTGEIVAGPDIVTRGFVYAEEAEELITDAKTVVREAIAKLDISSSTDWESARATVRSALNKFVYARTKRRPMVIPVILEV